MKIKAHAQRQAWRDSIDVHLSIEHQNGSFALAEPVVFKEVENVGGYNPPFLSLQFDEAQRLMDELWNCGLRPTDGSGSAGSLAATEKHLKDMSEIAKGLLRKNGVQLP